MDFVVAGASFPCGVGELGEVASRHGFSPMYLDHPVNSASVDAGLSPLRLEPSLPRDDALRSDLFLPLLESRVSEGRKLPVCGGLRFDRRAAAVSRSKHALSATLAEAGVRSVPRHRVASIEDAIRVASEWCYPMILRADTGYSGRGVWVAESADELRAAWSSQSNERAGAEFAEMRAILDADHDVLVVEPWLAGDEWSVDCVVGPTGVNLIRACEKVTAVVAGRPITLGYRLTDDADLWAGLHQAVAGWCRVLFQAGEVSFACFDIRRNRGSDFVPLDFGIRLGGDSIPLLVRRAGRGRNAYAAALDAALAGDPSRLGSLKAGLAIVHAFARQPGTFGGIAVLGEGEVIHSRPVGYAVRQRGAGPVYCRVGTILTCFGSSDDFGDACRTSAAWIRVSLDPP